MLQAATTLWVGVDFDGTLAKHSGPPPWKAGGAGDPVPAMVERVKLWLSIGHPLPWGGVTRDIRIFSARADEHAGSARERQLALSAIRRFCRENLGRELPITNRKDYGCVALYDDIAVQVIRDTGELVA